MRIFRKHIVLWLSLLYLCAGILAVPRAEAADYALTDWMKYLPDTMQISQVNIPGTHDSGTTYIWSKTGRYTAQCQTLYFPEQMEHGCRWFDIRLGEWQWDDQNPKAYSMRLCHGLYDCLQAISTKTA